MVGSSQDHWPGGCPARCRLLALYDEHVGAGGLGQQRALAWSAVLNGVLVATQCLLRGLGHHSAHWPRKSAPGTAPAWAVDMLPHALTGPHCPHMPLLLFRACSSAWGPRAPTARTPALLRAPEPSCPQNLAACVPVAPALLRALATLLLFCHAQGTQRSLLARPGGSRGRRAPGPRLTPPHFLLLRPHTAASSAPHPAPMRKWSPCTAYPAGDLGPSWSGLWGCLTNAGLTQGLKAGGTCVSGQEWCWAPASPSSVCWGVASSCRLLTQVPPLSLSLGPADEQPSPWSVPTEGEATPGTDEARGIGNLRVRAVCG